MRKFWIQLSIKAAGLACLVLLLTHCNQNNVISKEGNPRLDSNQPSGTPKDPLTPQSSGPLEGRTAPAWELEDASGNKVKLSDFEGKIVLLDFWATWCPPCVQEIPGFIMLHEKYKDKGVAVVGVSLDQGGWQALKPFIEKHKVTYPIVLGNMEVAQAYEIQPIPTTFILDPSGKIVNTLIGYHPPEVFEKEIEALLEKQKK